MALSAAITLGLTACGGESGGDENSQLAKENVYTYQEIELGFDMENSNINSMAYLDGKLYILVSTYEYDENGYAQTMGCYISNPDGTDSSFVELTREEREETYSWINNMLINPEGYIYAVENSSYEDSSDPDNYVYEDRYYLSCWDVNGQFLWSEQIAGSSGEEYSWCNYLLDGGEGKALVIMGGSRYEAVVYDTEGTEVSRTELDSEIFDKTSLVYTQEDGTMMMITHDDDWTKRYISSFDLNTGKEGEKTELPFSEYSYNLYQGSKTDLLLTNSTGIYTWNVGDMEPTPLMNYVNSDLSANNLNYIQQIDDQHFVGIYNDLDTWKQKCAYFTYVDPADIPDKQVLVLGSEYLESSLKSQVIEFNKTSKEYRITIKDYSIYNSNDDWNAGVTRLNNDITGGQCPDILVMNNVGNYSNYVSKGALADIGKLLEEDEELGQLEYLQNVWDAFSINGKLYAVIPSFSVRTMAAKKSLVGEPESWTMADVEAVLETMPEGATAFSQLLRSTYIYYMMSYSGSDFVNLETGKCNFNSQSFIDMLEYAKTLPAEFPEDYWENYDYTFYESQWRENRTLLYDLYIGNISDCKYQIKGYIGEEVSFVGFPTEESNGSVISTGSNMYMISAKSKHIDGAWQFVRQFLTEEYQTSDENYCMPVLKSAFLEKAKKATERPYWTDEDGNKEYYDDTWYINGEEIILEPFTQEEVDAICEFIYTVNRTDYYSEDILNIITEDAEAFFSGQKSVQEVVEIIQSRAQIFVNENR